MEPIIYDQTPLAAYLKDEGEQVQHDGIAIAAAEPSPPPSPVFAPVGQPTVSKRFRTSIPDHLRLDLTRRGPLRSLKNTYSKAVASNIDGPDNSKFLEQFRYVIIASQLLSGHSIAPHNQLRDLSGQGNTAADRDAVVPTLTGVSFAFTSALSLAFFARWIYGGGYALMTKTRLLLALVVLVVAAVIFKTYIRYQWLRYLREQSVAEVTAFVANSQDFDSATGAAIVLIQEVELVSRGYRLSTPLPPISRMEDRGPSRRCRRLRKVLKVCLQDVIQKYEQASSAVKGFAEPLDLERYYIMYDIGDFDISDAAQGFKDGEFEDPESLRALKVVAARFHTIRKIFLCALLALEAHGDDSDFMQWSTAMEGLRMLNEATRDDYERLRAVLAEEDGFTAPPAPKTPLSPGRERWRAQLRKLGGLSSGIRGLQAKMTLLREESDRSLNEAEDVSELGPSLMGQYESIGDDLKTLMSAWEEGKAALASGIDRNEKRLSSLSTLVMSPVSTLSGMTSADEGGGGVADALKALEGEGPPTVTLDFSSAGEPDIEEVFEAVALPRPRKPFNREERLAKMKEDREKRESARAVKARNLGMLHELETVIKGRTKAPSSPARTSL